MQNINVYKLSIYQIQMFLSVAESENITTSAQYLFISPSMLSKNIATIERELGLILFLRKKGRLSLTPAGRCLQQEFSIAMETFENAIIKAHAEQAVEIRPLRIGFPDSSRQDLMLLPSISNFKKFYPQFLYNVEFYPFKDLSLAIKNGNADVIFSAFFEESFYQKATVEYDVIARYPLTILVTPQNVLAQKDSVRIEDLKDMKLIIPSPHVVPNYYEQIIQRLLINQKMKLDIAYCAISSDAVVANVINDDNVLIADCLRKVDHFYDLIQIPIVDTESGSIIAWCNDSHPLAGTFAQKTISFWKANPLNLENMSFH